MSENVVHVAVVLRVDTDRRRLECVIDVPDGSPVLETALLVRQSLEVLGGVGWHEALLRNRRRSHPQKC